MCRAPAQNNIIIGEGGMALPGIISNTFSLTDLSHTKSFLTGLEFNEHDINYVLTSIKSIAQLMEYTHSDNCGQPGHSQEINSNHI